MEQKLVVHLKNGTIYKGVTHDFEPGGEEFHFLPAEGGGVPMRMRIDELKALFWVKSYLGNRQFVARRSFDEGDEKTRRAVITFEDGEQIWGILDPDAENTRGFFLFPVDREDNNLRIFVVRSALKEMRKVS